MTTIGTLDTLTDIYWQWQGLLILILNSCGNDWNSGYFYWPLVAMTGTLDTLTNLKLQCLGLWILLRTSSGNDRDSRILLLTSSGNDCSNMCGSRKKTGGPGHPLWKITSYMRFFLWKLAFGHPLKNWTLPMKNVGPPCKTVKSVEGLKKRKKKHVVTVVFRQSGLPPLPLWQRFLDPRIAKK